MPYVTPIMIEMSPTANVRLPAQSIDAGRRALISRSFRCDQTVPNTPSGTATMKISRHSIGASRPPTMSPMNIPLIPTTLVIPRASPRWWAGKASVRIAVLFASRKAAPTPWRMRNTISQSAPAGPLSQSIARNSEASVKMTKPRVYIRTRP